MKSHSAPFLTVEIPVTLPVNTRINGCVGCVDFVGFFILLGRVYPKTYEIRTPLGVLIDGE
ncbi:hypothetical protein PAENIP36_31730 [Paenibacillus sp. P36]